MDSVTSMSALLARQRHSNKLELRDVQHHLSRAWAISVPGYTQQDEWREAGGGDRADREPDDEEGDEERASNKPRGRDFSGGVAALQRLKAFRKATVSEGHKRRMTAVTQAKVTQPCIDTLVRLLGSVLGRLAHVVLFGVLRMMCIVRCCEWSSGGGCGAECHR